MNGCLPCMMLAGNGMGALGITDAQLSTLETQIRSAYARVSALPTGPNRDALMKRIQGYSDIAGITAQSITDDAYNQLSSDLTDIEKQAVASAVIPTFVATKQNLAPTGYGGAYMPVMEQAIPGVPNRLLLIGAIAIAAVLGLAMGKGKK